MTLATEAELLAKTILGLMAATSLWVFCRYPPLNPRKQKSDGFGEVRNDR